MPLCNYQGQKGNINEAKIFIHHLLAGRRWITFESIDFLYQTFHLFIQTFIPVISGFLSLILENSFWWFFPQWSTFPSVLSKFSKFRSMFLQIKLSDLPNIGKSL